MRGQEALTWGPFIIVALKNLFYSGFTRLPTSLSPKASPQRLFNRLPLYSPPHHPSLCLLQPPPCLPTSPSPHSSLSGWKVQWGCGIPEGQWGGGVEGLPQTRAQFVCKQGSSYRPVISVNRLGSARGGKCVLNARFHSRQSGLMCLLLLWKRHCVVIVIL